MESPKSESPTRLEFCEHLRERRREADISLAEIARITRIPEHSLQLLERARQWDERTV